MFTRKIIFIIAVCALLNTTAWGLVYHPEEFNDVPDVNWSEWPYKDFMARVNYSSAIKPSTTVIAPDFIMSGTS